MPWWHFEWNNGDGVRDVLPPDQRQLTIPIVAWGLEDWRVRLLLAVAVLAAVAGLITLIRSERPFRWAALAAEFAAAVGVLLALALATLTELFPTANPAVTVVREAGYFLCAVGCVLVIACVSPTARALESP
ncbi:MAG TPA: hypothetical protein VGR57_02490 [Ktedonobacterales bacterium]|nr:hypothetical protein [Ktedonobacterales bacterium]